MDYAHQRELTGLTAERDWEQARADRLMAAIQKHYDRNGNDLCWQGNDDELYVAAGLPPKQRQLPLEDEFERNCDAYRRDLYRHEALNDH